MLQGKVAVVTGGTRGIGFAIVRTFLQNGAKVILFGSRLESCEKAVSSLKSENPNWQVEGLYPNLLKAEIVAETIDSIKDRYGKIDILVNNAGISQSTSLYDYSSDEFEQAMSLNVNAIFHTIQPTARHMKEQGGGCIINTSSMVSISGSSAGVAYPTSKFAVNGLTISLARELGSDNIRVNAVAPGVINTDMVSALPDALVQGLVSAIPLQRIGQPQDVANAFLYLASDLADYVTGEILSVDGAMRS